MGIFGAYPHYLRLKGGVDNVRRYVTGLGCLLGAAHFLLPSSPLHSASPRKVCILLHSIA